jgi:hypothetical protein
LFWGGGHVVGGAGVRWWRWWLGVATSVCVCGRVGRGGVRGGRARGREGSRRAECCSAHASQARPTQTPGGRCLAPLPVSAAAQQQRQPLPPHLANTVGAASSPSVSSGTTTSTAPACTMTSTRESVGCDVRRGGGRWRAQWPCGVCACACACACVSKRCDTAMHAQQAPVLLDACCSQEPQARAQHSHARNAPSLQRSASWCACFLSSARSTLSTGSSHDARMALTRLRTCARCARVSVCACVCEGAGA